MNRKPGIGIMEFAQSELGEIGYISLAVVGNRCTKNEVLGSIEALTTVSELLMPVSGKVVACNQRLVRTFVGTHRPFRSRLADLVPSVCSYRNWKCC